MTRMLTQQALDAGGKRLEFGAGRRATRLAGPFQGPGRSPLLPLVAGLYQSHRNAAAVNQGLGHASHNDGQVRDPVCLHHANICGPRHTSMLILLATRSSPAKISAPHFALPQPSENPTKLLRFTPPPPPQIPFRSGHISGPPAQKALV